LDMVMVMDIVDNPESIRTTMVMDMANTAN
jgi:hypothetical protein